MAGIAGAIAGALVIGLMAAILAPPTWGYPGTLIALVAGTLAMGAVSVSMVWGHWYLTEGKLPAWPLRDLAWVLIGALALQVVVVLVNLSVPVRTTPTPSNGVDVGIFGNPALYLRLGVGILFPRHPGRDVVADDEDPGDAERDRPALHLHGRGVRGRGAGEGADVHHGAAGAGGGSH